jgi:hypothetical protein
VRRSGNCEYFSAALAVMLRALGVPARVVNGFQRGEWNPYGEYFLVRMGDAHSWVEAHVDGAGWITLDPSPRGEPGLEPATASVSLWLDAVRVRWYRYIVGWSRQDQLQAAVALQRVATRPWRLPWRDLAVPAGAAAAGLVAAAVVAWVAWRRLAAWGAAHAPVSRPPDFYRRTLRVLARAGLRPAPSETAREFAARVAALVPATAEPLAGITSAYEAVRFGGAVLGPPTTSAVGASLGVLAATLRRRAPASSRTSDRPWRPPGQPASSRSSGHTTTVASWRAEYWWRRFDGNPLIHVLLGVVVLGLVVAVLGAWLFTD